MQAERSTIKAAGRGLAVTRLKPDGPRDGPPLVFLHEGLGCTALWRDFPAALCARLGWEGVVYDRWGHGRSEPFDRPRHAGYLDDEAEVFLPALLDALAIPRCALFGHSDGGTIALLFAAAHPGRAAALVTEAAHVFVEELTLAGVRAAGEAYRTTDLPRRLARYHGERTESVFRGWHDTWLSPGFRGWNVEAALPRVASPLLVLQGAEDEYGTEAQVEAIGRGARGPVETAILPACAHVPHRQARAAVLERAAAFLRAWARGGGPDPAGS